MDILIVNDVSRVVNRRFQRILCLAVVVLTISTRVWGAPMDGLESTYTQPDGTEITLKFYGDEFYARTETADGYTVIIDPASRILYYAQLTDDGNEFVSTGIPAADQAPAALGVPKGIKLNRASRVDKARKRYEEYESLVKQRERWESVKESNRKYRAYKNEVRKQENSVKNGFVLPMGTILCGRRRENVLFWPVCKCCFYRLSTPKKIEE